MPRLSIVIPCTAADGRFEDTLVSVLQNRPEDCEVVVVFADPYDDPYELSGEVRFVVAPERSGLLDLINLGLEQAHAEVIHVLLCGVEVAEGWTAEPLNRLEDPEIAAVGPLLSSQQAANGSVVAGVAYGRGGGRRLCGATSPSQVPQVLGPTLCAGFYRRDAVQHVGGWDAAVGEELADVDLALSLDSAGYRAVCEPASRVRNAAGRGAGPDGFRAGRQAEYLFWKHAPRQGSWWGLMLHGLLIGGEMLQCLVRPRLVARLFGRFTLCILRPQNPRRPAVRLSVETRSRPLQQPAESRQAAEPRATAPSGRIQQRRRVA